MKTIFFKKALSVFTAMAMALSLMTGVPFSEIDLGIIASAAEPTSGFCGTNATWSLDDNGTLTISGTGAMANYSPSSPAPWKSSYSSIIKVVDIKSGVTSIGGCAFDNCASLTSITIPESVTSIGVYAFVDCISLESITIPKGVTSIDEGVFFNCKKLTTVTIPDSVTSIGNSAFYDCLSLTSIAIPEGVTSIGDYAFFCCTSLTSIAIPEGVTSIGDYAFDNCTSLESITIPESVISIGEYAFCKCSGLTSITIPESVTSIGVYAFVDCTSLESITIPKGVTSIDEGVFLNCKKLTTVTIPDSVTSISAGAFIYCTNLTSIKIPASVTSIGEGAFYGCTSLASVTIPDSVTSIGESAFDECTSLKTANVPCSWQTTPLYTFGETVKLNYTHSFENGTCSVCGAVGNGSCGYNGNIVTWSLDGGTLTIMGTGDMANYAYDNVAPWEAYKDSVTKVVIVSGVTSIGNSAFYNCSKLTTVTIPKSVTSIGESAFDECTSLKTVNVPCSWQTTPLYTFGETVKLNYTHSFENGTCSVCGAVGNGSCGDNGNNVTWSLDGGSLTISGVGAMANYSSSSSAPWNSYASDITAVAIESGVTSIGEYAFYECANSQSIEIPESVTSIGVYAFCYCTALKSITIPEGVTSISDYAFFGCTSLVSVTIPANVTSIGENAFDICMSLTSVTIASSVTAIGHNAFYECTSLETVTFGENSKLESIGGSAFFCCLALKSITIPEGVTSIGDYAFCCCDSLASVTIPASVTSIGESAFDEYPSLKTVNAPCNWDGSLYTFNSGVAVNIAPHTNTYSISGAVITVTCSECKATTGTLTISAAGGEYSGSAYTASVSGTGTLENEAPTITYCCDGGCINAGNHTASITMGGATATVEFTITRKPVTVTANNASKTYGEPDPTFTYTVTGLVNGDALTGKLTRESGENVGTYAITQGTLTNENNPNYAITFTNGTLTVSEKSSDGGSTPGEPDTPMRPADKVPFIRDDYGNSGWDAISTKIDEAKGGDTVIVDMNRATVVPGDIFEELKDKNVTMIIDLGDRIIWSVNGKDITSDNLKDIDFAVKQNTKNIPVDVVNNITGERSSIQISLAHNGEFGFTAVLSINLGSDNEGQKAALYYYNGSSLELMCESEISADGTAQLTFTHASDYVIVIGESKSDNNSGGTSSGDSDSSEDNSSDGAPSGDDNSDMTDSSDESKGDTDGNPSTGVAVSLMPLAAVTAFLTVSIKRKKKK